jgi:PAS domain S-box-containing protein
MISVLIMFLGGIIHLLFLKTSKALKIISMANDENKILSRILIQDSPAIFLAINSDGKIGLASDSLLDKLGYSREEVQGKSLSLIIPPHEQEGLMQGMRTPLSSQTHIDKKMSLVARDGKPFIIQWEPKADYLENGDLRFIYFIGTDITELKEALTSLQLTETSYHSIIKNLHRNAYQTGIDNIPGYLHGDIEQITGYNEHDFLTGSVMISDLILPEDNDAIREQLESLRTIPGYSTELTYRIRTKNGQTRWIRDFVRNRCDSLGSLSGIMGLVYDISSTKDAEESLLKSNERYTLLAENVKDVIWAVDADIRYTYISPSVEKMRGYTMEEIMTMSVEKVFTPESYQKMQKILNQVKAMLARGEISDLKKSLTFEVELLCKGGSTIWAEVTASYIIGRDGFPAGFVGRTRDISERKKAEESIRKSEETYRAIFESTGTAMVILDHNGVISLANTEFQDLSGYKKEELKVINSGQNLFHRRTLKKFRPTWE